jgi:hypothetical protein
MFKKVILLTLLGLLFTLTGGVVLAQTASPSPSPSPTMTPTPTPTVTPEGAPRTGSGGMSY